MPESMRKYHRYQVFAKAIVRLKGWTKKQGFDGQVNNISQGGMGVYTDIPFDSHIPVSVELPFPPSDDVTATSTLSGRVASLRKYDDLYFVGIAFDHVIPHDRFMKMIQMEY